MNPDDAGRRGALASLRRYVRPRATPVRERCGLCDAELVPDHAHLVEPATRRLACACEACAMLFSARADGRYRRVPRGARLLADFHLSDAAWDALSLPIDLAFFVRSTPAGGVLALYPSPAGATEALVSPAAWEALAAENPVLGELEPDVEALLVNRVGGGGECYRVGVDECYKLVGVIRTKWRGLSGGQEVWGEIRRFFDGLKGRSSPAGGSGGPHA
jgi:Family of unknown function (DUF5947)